MLPLLTTRAGPPLDTAGDWTSSYAKGADLVADVDRIAEVLNRLAIPLILSPSPVLPMPTDKAAEKLARELLVPMISARRSEVRIHR